MLPDVWAIKTIVTVAVGGAIEFPGFMVVYDENFLSRSPRRLVGSHWREIQSTQETVLYVILRCLTQNMILYSIDSPLKKISNELSFRSHSQKAASVIGQWLDLIFIRMSLLDWQCTSVNPIIVFDDVSGESDLVSIPILVQYPQPSFTFLGQGPIPKGFASLSEFSRCRTALGFAQAFNLPPPQRR
jgi:hypothetical protein